MTSDSVHSVLTLSITKGDKNERSAPLSEKGYYELASKCQREGQKGQLEVSSTLKDALRGL